MKIPSLHTQCFDSRSLGCSRKTNQEIVCGRVPNRILSVVEYMGALLISQDITTSFDAFECFRHNELACFLLRDSVNLRKTPIPPSSPVVLGVDASTDGPLQRGVDYTCLCD